MKYIRPEIEIQLFEAEDILTASSFSSSAETLKDSLSASYEGDAAMARWGDMEPDGN